MNLSLIELLAQQIVEQQSHLLPDLRNITIAIPNYFVAKPLAQALSKQSQHPTLLLPHLTTLTDWANNIALDRPIQADNLRISQLFHALKQQSWFRDSDLWSLSREILSLIDELSTHSIQLPIDEHEFAIQLSEAYQTRCGESLQLEARIIHELWFAFSNNNELDSVQAYQQRLARLAHQVTHPVYFLSINQPSLTEQLFLTQCTQYTEIFVITLRELAAQQERYYLLHQVLQAQPPSLQTLVNTLKQRANTKPHQENLQLKLFAAHSLEHEAQAADWQIRHHLLEGKQSIAVVILDRLVARRLRALLEHAQIQVQDETGWTFATLSVSSVLMRLLETIQNQFYYLDVLDLLKSPYLFADLPSQERKHHAWLFEKLIRKQQQTQHIEQFIQLAKQYEPELVSTLSRLQQATLAFNKRQASLFDWLSQLQHSLELLGIIKAWRSDLAGQQLIQLLKQWTLELKAEKGQCSFGEWKRWLGQQLDLNTFRNHDVESPVIFTHLAATRWREFDAVLLVGCDARHLPAASQQGRWFNDAVRQNLKLPTSQQLQQQQQDDLLGLLCLNHTVIASWQSEHNGEPNLLSPWLQLLNTSQQLAYQTDLFAQHIPCTLNNYQVSAQQRAPAQHCMPPDTSINSALLPNKISPSGYNALVACPYQFYARYILKLNPEQDIRETPDKRDYGTWVHLILQQFHQQHPTTLNKDITELIATLQHISQQVFSQSKQPYLAKAWLLRWQKHIPAYINWQQSHEQEGWRYHSAETCFNIKVNDQLTLEGRIDRIDQKDQQCAVLDYKTQKVSPLKGKLKYAGEDVQLACYAQQESTIQAAFIALDDDKVQSIEPPHELDELSALNLTRLQTIFEQLSQAQAIPANGSQSRCQHCEMTGICRLPYWQNQDTQ